MKTFEELDHELPNGFHDAKIRSVRIDYLSRTAELGMDLLVGVGIPDDKNKSVYRRGRVKVAGLLLFFIQAPDPGCKFLLDGTPLFVSGDAVRAGQSPEVDGLLPFLPPDGVAYRFFLEDWNSFLYLGGGDVEFSWEDSV